MSTKKLSCRVNRSTNPVNHPVTSIIYVTSVGHRLQLLVVKERLEDVLKGVIVRLDGVGKFLFVLLGVPRVGEFSRRRADAGDLCRGDLFWLVTFSFEESDFDRRRTSIDGQDYCRLGHDCFIGSITSDSPAVFFLTCRGQLN